MAYDPRHHDVWSEWVSGLESPRWSTNMPTANVYWHMGLLCVPYRFPHSIFSDNFRNYQNTVFMLIFRTFWHVLLWDLWYINGLVQERRNSIANALELRLSCTNPSIRLWFIGSYSYINVFARMKDMPVYFMYGKHTDKHVSWSRVPNKKLSGFVAANPT